MGIAERKERERAELREIILEGAMKVFLREGFEKTSIRKIAQAIEYSPATIYLYFQDKDQILMELQGRAFERKFTYMADLGTIEDPRERLRLMGRRYIDFALDNPDLYELMFLASEPMEHLQRCAEEWGQGKILHGFLVQMVTEGIEKGYFKAQDPLRMALLAWSAVHGMVSLHLRHRLDIMHPGDVRTLLHASIDQLLENFIR